MWYVSKDILTPEKYLCLGKDNVFHCHLPKKVYIIHLNEWSYSKLMMIPKVDNHHIKGYFQAVFCIRIKRTCHNEIWMMSNMHWRMVNEVTGKSDAKWSFWKDCVRLNS